MEDYLKKKYAGRLAMSWCDIQHELQLDQGELEKLRKRFKFGSELHISYRHFVEVVLDGI